MSGEAQFEFLKQSSEDNAEGIEDEDRERSKDNDELHDLYGKPEMVWILNLLSATNS